MDPASWTPPASSVGVGSAGDAGSSSSAGYPGTAEMPCVSLNATEFGFGDCSHPGVGGPDDESDDGLVRDLYLPGVSVIARMQDHDARRVRGASGSGGGGGGSGSGSVLPQSTEFT